MSVRNHGSWVPHLTLYFNFVVLSHLNSLPWLALHFFSSASTPFPLFVICLMLHVTLWYE
ncbi:hypothetical protein M405DRAFT_808508 [Rhizopogon salebrosus TDB-379]|nr:hypothetical protein M405DRAFT_808508 [Rhizopogon salebrosus TDB-379]